MKKEFASYEKIVEPHGYEVIAVSVTGCLHLKSAVTLLGSNVCWRTARGLMLRYSRVSND